MLWRTLYARVQPGVSSASAWLPWSPFDLMLIAGLVLAVRTLWRWGAGRRAAPWLAVPAVAAALWLGFLGAWGWHYQVPTLEARLRVPPDRLTPARAEAFARAAIAALNDGHAAAHAMPWPAPHEMPRVLSAPLDDVLPSLGIQWQPAWPRPRQTMIDLYFRWAGIDGMTNPFGLDVLINSRVLPMERPALVAHEYAHLAGFADESDASVVAWLACLRGDAPLQYSGWLAVLPHVLAGLPGESRRRVIADLEEGPRVDLRAIAARLDEQRPWVHALAWQTYDRFLKANRVIEGVARYDAVARVLIGAGDPATGRLQWAPAPWPSARGQ